MKIYQFLLVCFLILAYSQNSDSQTIKENELVVIQGEKFILHQVRTGETIYSISRDFKTESALLLKYNPNISEGLSIGDILKIPFNENIDLTEMPNLKKGNPSGFINHTIESNNETAYSISKKYKISVEDIYGYNPTVQRFKKGLVLKIPQWNYSAEQVKSEPVVENQPVVNQNKNDKDLIEYTVVSGETLFSIARKFNITENDIIQQNPEAKNLKAGSKLLLPVKSSENKSINTAVIENKQENYINHTIVSGETLYGITRKYKVTEEELKMLNPGLNTSFKAGTVIKIPAGENTATHGKQENLGETAGNNTQNSVQETKPVENATANCGTGKTLVTNKTFVVALFLPLYLEANDDLNSGVLIANDTVQAVEESAGIAFADTVIEEEKPVELTHQFYGNSENFLQFYEGVLLAVDSMQKAGMKIELNVFDTKDNPETVRKIINRDDFVKTDLIIGPVYENVQKEVALIAEKNQIPLISPFTPKSGIIGSNPYFYQINPTREYLAEKTIDLISNQFSDANFIVVETSNYAGTPEGQMVEQIRKKLAAGKGKYIEYDFRKERSRGLKNVLVADKENVVFIPSSDEGELSVAISNINNLADEYSITLIGTVNYQQKYPSIEVAHFHNLKLKYINPYWIDYSKTSTTDYIEKFVTNFGTEPNSYGVQGFDVSWYFLNALFNYGKDFRACLPYFKTGLLQGSYYFDKVSPAGGYMNKGVSVISYNRSFEVQRQTIIGVPESE